MIHSPHCNRACTPAGHTYSVPKRDHAHLAVMASRCRACVDRLNTLTLGRKVPDR